VTTPTLFSRRTLLAIAGSAAVTLRAQEKKHVPVGLLIYAVLADWKRDFDGTLTAVARMGYEGVELTQYESWTPPRAREVRKLLDSIGLKVFATHTEPQFFVPGDRMQAAIELNQILGTRTMCCVRGLATTPTGIGYHSKAQAPADAWKELTEVLDRASEVLKKHSMSCSFHNHAVEFQEVEGVKPIDILARAKGLLFHIDVNVCRRAGGDPVAFMKQYAGKTESLLLTDGPADANRHAPALGKGDTPWREVFATAESVGGIKYYLLTHGATELTPLETVKRDLEQYTRIHGAG
jgi:sugar phosphate isomerase/epimerase